MHVVRHEAIAQQRKTVEFGILPEQVNVNDAVGGVGQNYLAGVATLGNMMGNVDDHYARQPRHCMKVSEVIRSVDRR